MDDRLTESEVRASIDSKMEETGEKQRLRELLQQRLVETGWHDEMKQHCRDVIRRKGMEEITIEELVKEITPRGRGSIPDSVKAELLQRIRQFIQSHNL